MTDNSTVVIIVPIDRVSVVEEFLGRKLAQNQVPKVAVRVPRKFVKKIRQLIKEAKK